LGVVARIQLLVVTPSAARPLIDFTIDLHRVVSPLLQQWLQDGTHEEVAYDSGRRPQEAVCDDGGRKTRLARAVDYAGRQSHTCPSFDPTFLDAENEDGAGLDHGPSFSIVEATCDAGNDTLASRMYETEGIDCGLYVASERGYVRVAGHV